MPAAGVDDGEHAASGKGAAERDGDGRVGCVHLEQHQHGSEAEREQRGDVPGEPDGARGELAAPEELRRRTLSLLDEIIAGSTGA